MMTMGGIRPFAFAFRNYSDPPGYSAPDGTRLDGFDACRDTRYGDCWQGLIWTLQGDLRFPPSADSYRTTQISSSFAELIAVAYPSDEHIALLKEIAGADLAGGSPREALFYREPGFETQDTPPLSLPDVVFPFLAQGYLRSGSTGRESLAMLNASDYGGHHHLDSLNLYYWKDGHELLSDLGYLWDHPDKPQTYRTFAHNLVVIDGRDQQRKGRGGNFHLFSVTPHVKAMEASSAAYGPGTVYRRTCVLIDHGQKGSYLIDFFRAGGGKTRDYVFHGPGNTYELEGPSLAPLQSDELSDAAYALKNPHTASGELPLESLLATAGRVRVPGPGAGTTGRESYLGRRLGTTRSPQYRSGSETALRDSPPRWGGGEQSLCDRLRRKSVGPTPGREPPVIAGSCR